MKVCIVAEGCYPYVVGGVSSWIDSMIRSFPDIEFSILTIISDRTQSGRFAYQMPDNVTEVYESYLIDYDWSKKRKYGRRTRLSAKEYEALRGVVLDNKVDWDALFDMFQSGKIVIDDLLMGADFLKIVQECYNLKYSHIVFSDFLWTMRSIYLPLFLIMKTNVPKADLYHCVSTGYAGVLGCIGRHLHGGGLLLSEHGIYTREREEEIIKANWVEGIYKNIWIDQFRKMSRLIYERADTITCLYDHAKELQLELGCPEGRIRITPNGIDVSRFENLPGKTPEEEGNINIGAILRVTPIKDVKTMIRAFFYAQKEVPNLKLWIMGPVDEEEDYAKECFDLVESLKVPGVVFTGRINVRDYLGKMDFTILTSISEGQPLTILESFAAKKAVIATDVGNCKGLIYGEDDEFGTAGILTHIMNISEISKAIVTMAKNKEMCEKMGEIGYQRVMERYQIHHMQDKYKEIYGDQYYGRNRN